MYCYLWNNPFIACGRSDGMQLRFHWMLPRGGERPGQSNVLSSDPKSIGLPDLDAQLNFCRRAEEIGIDSLLTAFGYFRPDPMVLATALGMATQKSKFIVAYRPGLISPTLFVQQVNTLAALTNGRVSLNIIAGYSQKEQGYYGDFLGHDQRYHRAGEFLEICQGLWRGDGGSSFKGNYYQVEAAQLNTPFVSKERSSPEIYVGGGSPQAQEVAARYGSCWLTLIDTVENLRPQVQSMLVQGIEVGLRCSVIARPTRKEALEAAYSLTDSANNPNKEWVEKVFVQTNDSQSIKARFDQVKEADSDWITPCLWRGAVPYFGPSSVALVGTPLEIAEAILAYKQIGCSQFILSGSNQFDAITYFGEEVLPLIRKMEKES